MQMCPHNCNIYYAARLDQIAGAGAACFAASSLWMLLPHNPHFKRVIHNSVTGVLLLAKEQSIGLHLFA
jgi:hypothetical protein